MAKPKASWKKSPADTGKKKVKKTEKEKALKEESDLEDFYLILVKRPKGEN